MFSYFLIGLLICFCYFLSEKPSISQKAGNKFLRYFSNKTSTAAPKLHRRSKGLTSKPEEKTKNKKH